MARLHGIPDWFRLHATKWHGARQIGNAVPPPLARPIASEIMKALGTIPSRIQGSIELGESMLLNLNSSSAATYFGVRSRPNRRTQKSGVKKRRQIDIEEERLLIAGQDA